MTIYLNFGDLHFLGQGTAPCNAAARSQGEGISPGVNAVKEGSAGGRNGAISHDIGIWGRSCCADCDISSPTPAHGGVLVCYKFTGIVDGQHLARKEIAKNIYIYIMYITSS